MYFLDVPMTDNSAWKKTLDKKRGKGHKRLKRKTKKSAAKGQLLPDSEGGPDAGVEATIQDPSHVPLDEDLDNEDSNGEFGTFRASVQRSGNGNNNHNGSVHRRHDPSSLGGSVKYGGEDVLEDSFDTHTSPLDRYTGAGHRGASPEKKIRFPKAAAAPGTLIEIQDEYMFNEQLRLGLVMQTRGLLKIEE